MIIAKRIGAFLLAVIFIILTAATAVAWFCSAASNYLSTWVFGVEKEIVEPGAEMFYTPKYPTLEAALENSRLAAIRTQAEGSVLLENNGALPLSDGERRISVFGTGSVNIAFGGTGSGEGNKGKEVGLYEALQDEGFEINPALHKFYKDKYSEDYRRGLGTDMNGAFYGAKGARNYGYSINEIEREKYTAELRASYKDYSDAAIIVFSRSGGEGQDLPTSMAEFYENDDKHYLELTDEEETLIEEVKSGGFKKIIVLLNTLNTFECGFLKDEGIDAALWIGGTGKYGMTAVAKILKGEMSPEGRLPDIYPADLMTMPSMQNYGDNRFVDNGNITTAAYVAYAEGIYIGYRYYETAAMDGFVDYEKSVVYPFGYGLSYTEFEWSGFNMTETDAGFDFSVTVTNTGTRAGRDVTELYLTKPYTLGGIEKAEVELAGFAKTKELAPGESEKVSISVPRHALSSYDTYGEKTYVADAGKYVFSIRRDSHTPVYTLSYELADREFHNTSVTGYEITNRFETDTYSSRPSDLKLLSRADWAGTWPEVYGDGGTAGKATLTMTAEKKASILAKDSLGDDGKIEKPVHSSGEGIMFADVFDENGKALDYNDPKWQKLVRCLTPDDLYYLISGGASRSPAIETINKRLSITSDSPMGLHVGTLFPCYPIQAATWSVERAAEIGECIAEESLWNDIRGWYAPAMDTHRHPFGGRNYEYYSEDGVLAGKYAASVVKAAKARGLYFHIKHFALNDQDTNRGDRGNFRNGDPYNGLCTYAGEQSIREIYLKPFELAITEGGANGVMTSYNRIGDTWAGGHRGLLTEVLRNEWGFKGNALTDFAGSFGYEYMDMDQGLRAGNTQWLFEGDAFPITDRTSDEAIHYMQKAAKDILYAEASSSRVNNQRFPDGTSVTVKRTVPVWKIVLTVLWAAYTAIFVAFSLRKKRKNP